MAIYSEEGLFVTNTVPHYGFFQPMASLDGGMVPYNSISLFLEHGLQIGIHGLENCIPYIISSDQKVHPSSE